MKTCGGGNDNSTPSNNLSRPEALLHAVPRVSCDQHSVEKATNAAVFGNSALEQRLDFGGSQVELRVLCALELKWMLQIETRPQANLPGGPMIECRRTAEPCC
jgi:hypothetical protein